MLALLAFAAALFSPPSAAAKDGVRATLTTNVPLDARPGTALTIGWTLAYDENGRRRPFGASGVFVRLLSAAGGAPETGFAAEDRGRYTANVAAPEGGIGDVEIGLRGWTSGEGGSRRSDLLFPITNDPMPGPARVAAPPPEQGRSERAESRLRLWIVPLLTGGLIAVLAIGAACLRRLRAEARAEVGVRPG